MKKYLAALLAIVLVLTLSVPAFADEKNQQTVTIGEDQKATVENTEEREVIIDDAEDTDKPILNTDVASSDYEMTHFDDRAELEETRFDETEDAYADLYKYIGRDATFSVYWFEADYLPMEVTITVENLDEYKSYGYLYWKDDKIDNEEWDCELTEEDEKQHLRDNWYELKHEFDKFEVADEDLAFDVSKEAEKGTDKKTHTVTLTIESNQPIAIVSPYGLHLAGLDEILWKKHLPPYVYSIEMPEVIEEGSQTAAKPTLMSSDEDVNIVPYKDVGPDLELITEEEWAQFKEGCKQLKDQVPEKMTTRYLFYLIEEKPSDIVIRMEDIDTVDKVKCKLFNGSWTEEYCKVIEPGRISIHADGTGLFAIFTEIETDIFED